MNKYAIIVSSLIFILSSCMSMREVSLDYLKPAEVSFPDQLKNVVIISTIPQNDLDSIIITNKGTIVGDQNISKNILAKRIADSHYFETVIACDSVMKDCLEQSNSYLSPQFVKEILSDFKAEMIISLEKMDVSVDRMKVYHPENPLDVIRFVTKPEIKFYISNRKAPVYTISQSDTTYYNAFDLLDYKTAFLYAYDDVLKKNIDIVLPHWEQADRYYYTGGTYEMRDAEVAVKENDWSTAFKLWESVYTNKKGKLRGYAAFNIALYYELNDNIKEALNWLNLAEASSSKDSEIYKVIQLYKGILSQREIELSTLKLQMNRFN